MEEMAIFQDLPNDYERSMKKVWDWKHEKEGLTYKELAERIHMDDQTISRLINNKRDPSINSLVLICLGMHLPPEISMHLIDKSPVALNYNKNDHIWYKFALTHLSKQSMISIENFSRNITCKYNFFSRSGRIESTFVKGIIIREVVIVKITPVGFFVV